MGYARRFNDLVGLGFEGYPALLALALYAWHERRGERRSASSILYEVLQGSEWFREKRARGVVSSLDSRGYLEFECQSPMWRPGGWRRCPRDWRLTEMGYRRLQELLGNLNLTVDDILQQPSPQDVKALIDGRIKTVYREHWERVRRYEEAVVREDGL
jgi:hypothetical protein